MIKNALVFNATKAQRNLFFRNLYKMDMNLGTKTDQNVVSTGAPTWKAPLKSWQERKWTFLFILLNASTFHLFYERSPFKAPEWISHAACLAVHFACTFNAQLLYFWKQVFLWFPGLGSQRTFERSIIFFDLKQVLHSCQETLLLKCDWLLCVW